MAKPKSPPPVPKLYRLSVLFPSIGPAFRSPAEQDLEKIRKTLDEVRGFMADYTSDQLIFHIEVLSLDGQIEASIPASRFAWPD